jgi:hypothetical protein
MISNSEFWFDLRDQADEWRTFIKAKYRTGYGGQHRENETISALDFQTLKHDWKLYGQDHKLETRTAASLSGREDDVVDFICHAYGKPGEAFCYHIIVPGVSSDPRIGYL